VLRCIWPGWSAARIAWVVLAATCCLEFLQLWHPPLLETLRSHFLGATILGTTFEWSDPYGQITRRLVSSEELATCILIGT
jgi:hypothetical protein